ncbi:MAG: alpha/beta fold hydrolase, partial [Bdellovibrionaceae bacterium]|nr:alpha/beta fold hydrolase [Pseudobdellovibrionaceae bacterium]
GPSSSSHSSFSTISKAKNFFDHNNKTSFVFVDQRGTGCSDGYPDANVPNLLERLRYYGTRGIVSDSEYIKQKIYPNKKWNIFGQSYGAFIVHRYAILNIGSVNGALAHANTINSDGYERVKNRIASQVQMVNEYTTRYPDDKKILEVLKSNLKFNTCFVYEKDPNQKSCGYQVLEIIAANMLGFSDQWITIHKWLGLLVDGNQVSQDGIGYFLNTFYFSTGTGSGKSKSIAGKVISWVDRNLPPLDTATCNQIQNDLLKNNIDVYGSFANECLISLQAVKEQGKLPIDSLLPYKKLQQDLLTLSDFVSVMSKEGSATPFYLYSGTHDTYVPEINFSEEIAAIASLKNIIYTNFSSTGHDGYLDEAQVWKDLISVSAEK